MLSFSAVATYYNEEESIAQPELLRDEIIFDNVSGIRSKTTEHQFWKWRNYDIFTEVRTPASSISSESSSKPKPNIIHFMGLVHQRHIGGKP